MTFSPDGRYILSAGTDKSISLWDAQTGKVVRRLEGEAVAGTTVAFSPDGHTVAFRGLLGTLKIWENVETGTAVREIKTRNGVLHVAFSRDGRNVMTLDGSKCLEVLDVGSGEPVRRSTSAYDFRAESLALSPDGRFVALGGEDKRIVLWETGTWKQVCVLQGHTGSISSLAISPDGRQVLSASRDKTLVLWDLQSGKPIRTLLAPRKETQTLYVTLYSATFSPDGRRAMAGMYDGTGHGTVKLWEIDSGKEIASFSFPGQVTHVAFSPDGRRILAARSDGREGLIELWDDTQTYADFRAALTPDGRYVVAGSSGRGLRRWDAATGRELPSPMPNLSTFTTVSLSPGGRWATAATTGGTLYYCVPLESYCQSTSAPNPVFLNNLVLSEDGKLALGRVGDTTLKLYRFPSGKPLEELECATPLNGVVFGPGGQTALSFGKNGTLKLWDLEKGRVDCTLTGHTGPAIAAAVSGDGRWALSGGEDQAVKLWDLGAQKEARTLSGHTGAVTAVALSPDGRWALSGGRDRTVKLWDLKSGKEVRTLATLGHAVTCVSFRADGRRVLWAAEDETFDVCDLGLPSRYARNRSAAASAVASLQKSPGDGPALAALGEAYASRGVNDRAVDLLEKARRRPRKCQPGDTRPMPMGPERRPAAQEQAGPGTLPDRGRLALRGRHPRREFRGRTRAARAVRRDRQARRRRSRQAFRRPRRRQGGREVTRGIPSPAIDRQGSNAEKLCPADRG